MRAAIAACLAVLPLIAAGAHAQEHHHHGGADSPPATPPTFVASSAKPFSALMDDAMNVMDAGMRQAPMNGNPDHDFVTMMMPHHQGAVDMAKAVLLSTQDPEIRNLALGIIAEQQIEIKVMQAWLQHHKEAKQ
ncbi:DUF305 domain-containing protein [Duganella radicis]|uniref:DUF305 domain-containing protein n=1 Tax=Duganella radicis TaxID=551988 RepID=A0A6L6PKG0_9BURK|nr:DUF305 domain-containing protein [Duganella radicis]